MRTSKLRRYAYRQNFLKLNLNDSVYKHASMHKKNIVSCDQARYHSKKFSTFYSSEIDVINKTRVMTEEIEYLPYDRIYQPFQSTKVDALTSK